MGEPLITIEETREYRKALQSIDEKHGYHKKDRTGFDFQAYWDEKKACENAHALKTIRRAQERPEDFLNALLICVAHKGEKYVPFFNAFEKNDEEEALEIIKEADTPENRRWLYTMLKALTEIPKSWGRSAFVRFLRGQGKQKDAKYFGAGMFGTLYGWKAKQIETIAEILTSSYDYRVNYSSVLMSYADVEEEINEADPDWEIVDRGNRFAATRVERDVEFLNKLCDILEERGLGPIPTPKEAKPKKKRVPKVFKPGDIIRKNTIRDLPLPAHVRIPVDRRNVDEKGNFIEGEEWYEDFIEKVVFVTKNNGYMYYGYVVNGKVHHNVSYRDKGHIGRKTEIEGATFLGKWTGKVVKKSQVRPKFRYCTRGFWTKRNSK